LRERFPGGPLQEVAVAGQTAEIDEALGILQQAEFAFGVLDVMSLIAVVDDGFNQRLFDRADRPELFAVEPRERSIEFEILGLGRIRTGQGGALGAGL